MNIPRSRLKKITLTRYIYNYQTNVFTDLNYYEKKYPEKMLIKPFYEYARFRHRNLHVIHETCVFGQSISTNNQVWRNVVIPGLAYLAH